MRIKEFFKLALFIFIFIIPSESFDALKKKYFLTTKYNEVNVRNGPGLNNLIVFKILRKGYPLLTIEKFEDWLRIIDYKDRTGWVSKTQLNNDSHAITLKPSQEIHKFPSYKSKTLAYVKDDFVLRILKCRDLWCKVTNEEITGWILKINLWGIE